MKRKENWTIPNYELTDGGILARKNAVRLMESAQILFENGKYSTSLVLSVLAFEEYGKFLMFYDANVKKRKITKEIWENEFKKHEKKLESIPNILSKQKTFISSAAVEKARKHVLEIIKKWGNLKFSNIYLDWNPVKEKWMYPDEDEFMKKSAKEVLRRVTNFIKIFQEGGDLSNVTIKERIQLLTEGKAYVICEKCGKVMWDLTEVKNHKSYHVRHIFSWWRTN